LQTRKDDVCLFASGRHVCDWSRGVREGTSTIREWRIAVFQKVWSVAVTRKEGQQFVASVALGSQEFWGNLNDDFQIISTVLE